MTRRTEPRLEPTLPAWALAATMACFFTSGAAGLVYEVVWTRALLTVFGATQYAVATVLAAFMGGLALGSWAGGRISDRLRRPLAVYGVLELAVAVAAVAVAPALELFDPLYRLVYRTGGPGFIGLGLLRFAVCGLVLLVPTTLMGATLPLLSRFVVRSAGVTGRRIGALYAINTTGAVAGTVGAGFLLIPALGVSGALYAAAAAGAGVALASLALSWFVESDPLPTPDRDEGWPTFPEPAPSARRLVLATYGAAGFLALAYQVLWTRSLVFQFDILKNTTYAFSAMLAVFLVGLSAGSAVMSALVDRQRRPMRLYGMLLVATGAAGAMSLFVLLRAAGGIEIADATGGEGGFRWTIEVANVFARTAATIGLPTFLMGALFPVAARLAVGGAAVGRGTGTLYAANTVGAILGAFAAGFGLVPVIGLSSGLVVLGCGYVVLGIVVLALDAGSPLPTRAGWSAAAVAVAVAIAAAAPGGAPLQRILPGESIVVDDDGRPAYVEGPVATVSVVENRIGDRTIHIDNAPVAGTDRILLTDQLSLAHVPMLLHPNPERVLTVGFGSGGASASYLLYDEARQVDCVEISPTVPKLAHTLRASNLGLLDEWDRRSSLRGRTFHDGRYRIILDDARSYLGFSDVRYDVIATDCTDLRYKSNANLYDVEYFDLCRRRLDDDGLMVVWMPLGGMSPEVFASAMRTFVHVFPEMTVWYMNNEPTHYLLLVAGHRPLRIDLPRILARTARREIRADLARVDLHQPAKLLSCYLTDGPAIAASLERINPILNTEDNPYLEFESPKYGVGDEPLLSNLELLRRHRLPVAPLLDNASELRDEVARIERFSAPVDLIMEGHAHLRRLEIRDAARSWSAALAMNPEDDSLRHLLLFDDLRRRLELDPGDPWAILVLSEVALERGAAGDAAAAFRVILDHTRDRSDQPGRILAVRSALGLAEAQLALGDPRAAIGTLDAARDLLGDNDRAATLRRAAADALGAGGPEQSDWDISPTPSS